MSVELTEVQKHDFLVDLIQKTYPTIDCDDYSFSWWDIDGGLHIQLNEKDYDRCEECNGEGCDERDNLEEESTEEESLCDMDLFYVRKDDMGHLIKAVEIVSPEITREMFFYAHGHILACLLLN